MTNRELYLAIDDLREKHQQATRSLKEYLLALLGEARHYKDEPVLAVSTFYALVVNSFTVPPLPFDSDWQANYPPYNAETQGYPAWEATIIRQIVDLQEMEQAGLLANDLRYFGIDAPRGTRWYNFDALTYLECGMSGSFGGWEPDDTDTTGRAFVPGMVAILDDEGKLQTVNPKDITRKIRKIDTVSWEQFIDFIECGQWYE